MSQPQQSRTSRPSSASGKKPADRQPSALVQLFSSTALLLGISGCVLVAALAVSIAGGVIAGQNELNLHATQTTTADLSVQFDMGMQDLQQGHYGLAAQRFRWIVERVPDYPGAAEALAQAENALSQVSTPDATLSPSNTQNPDELFTQAQGYYNAQEWANAIARLQELQTIAPTYREVEVSEMLYQSLVTLGLQYVRGDRLQEGLALLGQAEKIRPLDDLAAGERNLASLYTTGRTYFGLSWVIAIDNFQAIYDVAPNYRDVKDRLWEAHVKYGDELVALGGHCDAASQYDAALALRRNDELQAKYDAAAEACANPTPTPLPTLEGGVTATPGGTPTYSGYIPPGALPTETPTPTP